MVIFKRSLLSGGSSLSGFSRKVNSGGTVTSAILWYSRLKKTEKGRLYKKIVKNQMETIGLHDSFFILYNINNTTQMFTSPSNIFTAEFGFFRTPTIMLAFYVQVI